MSESHSKKTNTNTQVNVIIAIPIVKHNGKVQITITKWKQEKNFENWQLNLTGKLS